MNQSPPCCARVRAAANDAAGQIAVLDAALAQLPEQDRKKVLVRGDTGSGVQAFVDHIHDLGLRYSVGVYGRQPVLDALAASATSTTPASRTCHCSHSPRTSSGSRSVAWPPNSSLGLRPWRSPAPSRASKNPHGSGCAYSPSRAGSSPPDAAQYCDCPSDGPGPTSPSSATDDSRGHLNTNP